MVGERALYLIYFPFKLFIFLLDLEEVLHRIILVHHYLTLSLVVVVDVHRPLKRTLVVPFSEGSGSVHLQASL
jgi:hypothetical protein